LCGPRTLTRIIAEMLSRPARTNVTTTLAALGAALLLSVHPSARLVAQTAKALSATEAESWRADLRALAAELPKRHPLLFEGLTPTRLTAARFDSAVQALDARIPSLPRHRVIVELERLVAMVGAGHTSINPLFDPAIGFRYYPLELRVFRDGIYVRRAGAAQAALAGARVLRIGRLSADSALALAATVLSHENEQFVRAHAPAYLMMPEVLDALGIADDMEKLPLELEKDGRRWTAIVAPGGRLAPNAHATAVIDQTGWIDMRPASVPAPLYLSRGEPRWFRFLPERRTLYVAYQSSVPPQDGGGETIDAFFTRVLAAADEPGVERLVLDVRGNTGGESFYNRQLLLGIIRRTRLDQRGKLFVVIGRNTYSAAMNLVNELERYTNATFVGEPTGSPPAFFGDHRSFTLPNSGSSVNVSSLWWQTMNPRDKRPFVAPQIYAEESADHSRAGRDPALDAIFARAERPTLAALLVDALAAGDTARAWQRLSEYIANPENRYLGVEAEVNALGYEQLRLGHADRAAQLLSLNVRAYPRSANAYDSLGEAYERSGRSAEAAEMYRRALSLDAGMSSSRDGLRRLGQSGQ
jgi:hypothetical protein